LPDVADQWVEDFCKRWLAAEVAHVEHMMRRMVGRDRDRQLEAASVTALSFLQSVVNGTGIARMVRDHVEGRAHIESAKAVFNMAIQYHRQAAIRWLMGDTGGSKAPEAVPDSEMERIAARHLRSQGRTDDFADECLQARTVLVELADAPEPDPASAPIVDGRMDELESCCFEPVRRHGVFVSLSDRQRMIFLLRIEPLNTFDATALEYLQVVPLSGILGRPTNAQNLRDSLRAALMRLRLHHTQLKGELLDG
jgi:hypothetical protein